MTPETGADAPEYTTYTPAIRWIILLAVMLGAILEILDTSIVNVALPTMMGNLGATLDQISWVSTGYIIANVIILPLTGWLSNRFGRRRYLAGSMLLFTIASLFCGLSRSLEMLVIFRILQGMGGAALISTAQSTMIEIFPPAQTGMVTGIFGLGMMMAPTLGPTLGGWITDNYSWPWIFFINLPIGALATTLTLLFARDSRYQRGKNRPIDLTGIALLAIGLGCLQTVLEKGNRENWFDSSLICWLTALAVSGLAAFVVWELTTEYPAVNLRILSNRSFAAGTVIQMAVGVGLYGGIFLLPVFLQQVQHYSAEQTGWILFPGGLATGMMMPIIGKLVSRVQARKLAFVGVGVFALAMLPFTRLTLDTGPSDLFWPWVIRGASLAFLFVPLTIATLRSLQGQQLADGTGLFNLARQLGGSAGIAFLATFLDHNTKTQFSHLSESVTLYNPTALARLQQLQSFFIAKGASFQVARQQAQAAMEMLITRQASVLAFERTFMVIVLIFIAMLPLIFLLRKNDLRSMQKPAAE